MSRFKILRKVKDEHFEEYHAKEKCDCGLDFEKSLIEKHKVISIKNKKFIFFSNTKFLFQKEK